MAIRTEGRSDTFVAIALAATLLLWPALWNGYPLVFSDTGTYLAQAIEHYVGWTGQSSTACSFCHCT